jgi:enoyl-CoA hydratase/carnithine racemase
VILTGVGGEFIPGIDFSSFGNVADPSVWSQVHDEGIQILENLANIQVPVIAAVDGRAHVHSEYALLVNVIVAAQVATFNDVPHFAGGIAPRDGIFTTWSYRAGAGRAEAFLLNPRPLTARTACEWGVLAGVVPNGKTLARARELAALYLKARRGHATEHACTFHSTAEGAHRARGRLRTLRRRSISGRSGQINAGCEVNVKNSELESTLEPMRSLCPQLQAR